MGKKYIYGSITTDTINCVNQNEFHYLCKCLGSFLRYEKQKTDNETFKEYILKNNVKDAIETKDCWGYINEAQKFIRDNLAGISRQEIRKLGWYYFFSRPAFPKKSNDIATVMFSTVFENEKYSDVAELFLNYIFMKWAKNPNKNNYYSINNPYALEITTTYFIGFQQQIINRNSLKYKNIFDEFRYNKGYGFVQKGLDQRMPKTHTKSQKKNIP